MEHPTKHCDYCEHVGMAYTWQNGETICDKCLKELPHGGKDCRILIRQLQRQLAEERQEVERLTERNKYLAKTFSEFREKKPSGSLPC